MSEELTGGPEKATPPGSPRQSRRGRSGRHLPEVVVGTATLALAACAAIFALAAFSNARSPDAGGASSPQRLVSGSMKMPSQIGSLCGSTRQTATSTDTALGCKSFGVSSFAADAYQAAETAGVPFDQIAGTVPRQHSGEGSRTGSGSAGTPSGAPGLPGRPGVPGVGSSKTTCESTPKPPSELPSLPSLGGVSVSITGDGGKTSVSGSSTGGKVCVKPPSTPSLPSAPSLSGSTPSLPSLPSVSVTVKADSSSSSSSSAKRHTSKKHKKHKKHHKKSSTSVVQSVVNDVVNGLGGL